MSLAKLLVENLLDNTYGIEVEFGTHDSQVLSFTHIEVCYLFPFGSNRNNGWKIETDADYTLEIVSPILKFPTQQTARNFRDDLMRFLEQQVRNGILLAELMRRIEIFVNTQFTFAAGGWTFIPPPAPLQLTLEWISNADLDHDLSWENWDEDTDLERVLAAKRIIHAEAAMGPVGADQRTARRMQEVMVTASRKHGGLPSSQLNLPLELSGFAYYETRFKRDKAWERLLETETSTPQYIADKIRELAASYPNLVASSPAWAAKHLNDDYIESQVDEKTPAWHRYWLWLETFYVCAGHLANVNYAAMGPIDNYITTIDQIVDAPAYPSRVQAKAGLTVVKQTSTLMFAADYRNNLTAALLYLMVHKLAGGALGELSETLQKEAQEKIMALDGDMSMDQVKDMIPDNQFMQFHYALKDLTSLWFKAPLVDVINAENNIGPRAPAVAAMLQRIANLPADALAGMICRVLKAHQKLLGWYFAVSEANNQEFDYDWEEFCSYNMPSIPAFRAALKSGCTDLAAYLNAPGANMTMLCTNQQLPQQYVLFLKRNYTAADNVPFMALNGIPAASVAAWEGRWDTMKPVILTDPLRPRYLLEHRNN